MTPVIRRLALCAGRAVIIPLCFAASTRASYAQGKQARVTDVAREVLFINAGSADGLALGDTVDILGDDGAMLTGAVVIALAADRANVRVLEPVVAVHTGCPVRLRGTAADVAVAVDTATAPVARDTARITYRTRELVFFAAGREQGLAVGDTVDILDAAGARITGGMVMSTSARSASARLLDPETDVPATGRVTYQRRSRIEPLVLAVAAPADVTTATGGDAPPPARPRRVSRGINGGIHLDQFGASAGEGFSSSQTALGLNIELPFGDRAALRMRTTSRYRSSTGALVPGGVSTIPYQLELVFGRPEGRARGSVGRFLAADAFALGYLDGVRFELQPARGQRVGVVAGLVPDPVRLQFRSTVRRVGGYWGVRGTTGAATASVAADWVAGEHQRTVVGWQTSWSPVPRVSAALYGDVNVPGALDPAGGVTLTSLYGSMHLPLPGGFRLGLGAHTYAAVRSYDTPADTFALPGRYTGGLVSVGRNLGRLSVEASGSALRRSGDPVPTVRGTLSLSNGPFYAMASGERGPVADYVYATGRLTFTRLSSPVALSLGGLYGVTLFQGAGLQIQRYSARPDLSWRTGRSLLLTLGADLGRYGGHPSTYVHCGVSYYFH